MIDAKAILTALALIYGAFNGGQVGGWGFEVAFVFDGERVELGVDPRLYMTTVDLPFNLTGWTLGNVALVRRGETWWDAPDWVFEFVRRERLKVFQYEHGHFDGYQEYGILYPLAAVEYPEAYDPCSPLFRPGATKIGDCERRDLGSVPPRPHEHSLFRFDFRMTEW